MKKGIQLVVEHIIMGLGIGSVISVICMALMGELNDTLIQVIAWLIASAGYGMVSLIYDAERLPIPLAIVIHFISCLSITVITCLVLKYGASAGEVLSHIVPLFCIIYIIIGATITIYGKICAKRINEKIN